MCLFFLLFLLIHIRVVSLPALHRMSRDDGQSLILVSITIEEDQYRPIVVERAVLSLYVDKLELCVPHTKFTVAIYYRDVLDMKLVTPMGGEDGSYAQYSRVNEGSPVLVLLTGVFAPRRYILCSHRRPAAESELLMVFDVMKSRIDARPSPAFPSARSPAWTGIQEQVFGQRLDDIHAAANCSTRRSTTEQPPATNLEHLSYQQPNDFVNTSQAWSRRKPPNVVATPPSQALDVNYSTTYSSRNASVLPQGTAVPPVDLSSGTRGYQQQPYGTPVVVRHEMAVQTADPVDLPRETPSRNHISGPPQGPIVSPQPPLWLLQRNPVKMDLVDQALHPQRGSGKRSLLPTNEIDTIQAKGDMFVKFAKAVKDNEFYLQTSDKLLEGHDTQALNFSTLPMTSSDILFDGARHSASALNSINVSPVSTRQTSEVLFPSKRQEVERAATRLAAKSSLAQMQRARHTTTRDEIIAAFASAHEDVHTSSRDEGTAEGTRLVAPGARSHRVSRSPILASPIQYARSATTPELRQHSAAPTPTTPSAPAVTSAPSVTFSMPESAASVLVVGNTSSPLGSLRRPEPASESDNAPLLFKSYTGIPIVAENTIVVDDPKYTTNATERAMRSELSGPRLPAAAPATPTEKSASVSGVASSPPPSARIAAPIPTSHTTDAPTRSISSTGGSAAPPAPPAVRPPPFGGVPMPHLAAAAAQSQAKSSVSLVARPTLDGDTGLLRRTGTR